jgi:hypothetical protein
MKEQPMTFVDGQATFVSRYRELVCWPIGPPRTMVADGRVVTTPASYAQFENNKWSTKWRDYARGMIEADHFYDHEGWMLDPMCVPATIRDLWSAFSTDTKRKIGLRLVSGDDPNDIFEELDDLDLEGPKAVAEQRVAIDMQHVCPVSGCGVKVTGQATDREAQQALAVHVRLVHPDWKA